MPEQKAPLNKLNALILTTTPLLAVSVVPYYGYKVGYDGFEWSVFILFMALTGMSITAGYHRLWSHKSYEARSLYRLFWAIWGACALQNSVLHWASDHRNHHRFVDWDDRDPYSAKRGFWFSHIGWILRKHDSGEDDFSNVQDLIADPVVRWQHKYYAHLAVVTNLVVPLLLGYWHGKLWGVVLLAGVLRLVLNHHFAFLINSLAHIWGGQSYVDDHTARDNHLLAFFTYGEGYHNYHHRFQWDYRNGVKWWHFDPGKWMIKLSSWLRLSYGLKRPSNLKIDQVYLKTQYNRAINKIAQSQASSHWIQRLEGGYEKLRLAQEDLAAFQKQWVEVRHTQGKTHPERVVMKKRYSELKSNVKHQRQEWRSLRSEIAA